MRKASGLLNSNRIKLRDKVDRYLSALKRDLIESIFNFVKHKTEKELIACDAGSKSAAFTILLNSKRFNFEQDGLKQRKGARELRMNSMPI